MKTSSKSLMILVVGADSADRKSVAQALELGGHRVFNARNHNQADAFIGEHGLAIDGVVVDMDTVSLDIELMQSAARNACFVMRSEAFDEHDNMPQYMAEVVQFSKTGETAKIEAYLVAHSRKQIAAAA